VANDVASATIAGYTFAWAGKVGGTPGGILNVRVALRGTGLADLARALGRVEGVRVTSGPAMTAGGECYLVHCTGFKMVVSSPAPGTDTAQGLVSRTIEATGALTSELSVALDRLTKAIPGTAARAPLTPEPVVAGRAGSSSSTLRRTPLRPGKTLARKAPLARRTPLRRGSKPDREPQDD
jgi:hypothetical protein